MYFFRTAWHNKKWQFVFSALQKTFLNNFWIRLLRIFCCLACGRHPKLLAIECVFLIQGLASLLTSLRWWCNVCSFFDCKSTHTATGISWVSWTKTSQNAQSHAKQLDKKGLFFGLDLLFDIRTRIASDIVTCLNFLDHNLFRRSSDWTHELQSMSMAAVVKNTWTVGDTLQTKISNF